MKYEYAEDGTLSAVTYPDGETDFPIYDSCGRLLSVMDGDEKPDPMNMTFRCNPLMAIRQIFPYRIHL